MDKLLKKTRSGSTFMKHYVEYDSFFRWNFPQNCCSAGCCVAIMAEVDLIHRITDLSHSFCLCHSAAAEAINVVKEPQVALTLQPYLWLTS